MIAQNGPILYYIVLLYCASKCQYCIVTAECKILAFFECSNCVQECSFLVCIVIYCLGGAFVFSVGHVGALEEQYYEFKRHFRCRGASLEAPKPRPKTFEALFRSHSTA